MNKKSITKASLISTIFLFSLIFLSPGLFSQDQEVKPVTVGQPMPDVTFTTLQGEAITLSKLKGKNVLLILPRGFAAEGRWCTIDNYKYADLVDIEKKEQISKKYNVEIFWVLPYSKEVIQQWVDSNPDQLAKIKDWKYPAEPDKQADKDKQWTTRAKAAFPKDLSMKKGEVPMPFPIVFDAEGKLSKGLGVFNAEWGGSKVDQNMASEFIIDKDGIVQFKYIGQNTWDRPSYEFLWKVLGWINTCK